MNNHGGKRKGAGRPPKADKRVAYCCRLSPEVREYLRQQSNATEAIETAIMRSKSFRDWKRSAAKAP